jgi:murein DD-endopeptidase MepM/ murein hydrolase activator NlpD
MADRRWTVMLIPHGSDSPRSFSVTEQMLRRAAGMVAFSSLMALVGIGNVIARISDFVSPKNANAQSTHADLSTVAERVASLRDTIAVIRQREAQIRLLAGLPSTDSAQGTAPAAAAAGGDVVAGDSSGKASSPESMRQSVDSLIEHAELLSSRFAAVTDSLTVNAARLASMPSIMPTAGWLSSSFSKSRSHPILHLNRPHEGIDVSAPMGAPIVAPASGVVRWVGTESGYGHTFEVDHGNGIITKYAHCSRIMVTQGQRVTRGQVIANVGNSGLSTGPHLHYEIHVNGKVVDPLTYVLSEAIPD